MLHLRLYYNFAKDTNSTKHPIESGTPYAYTMHNCEVWEPCTFHDPVFILHTNYNDIVMKDYVYAYVQEWKACYWINTKEFAEGRILLHCSLDPLATYRTAIRNSTQFVLRSASFQDEHIVDLQYPVIRQKQQVKTVALTSPFKSKVSDGVFVLGITSKGAASGSSLGSTYYISMEPSQMAAFMNALMNDASWLNVSSSELSSDLVKVILNPIQYIQSIKWFPLAPTSIRSGAVKSTLPIGWWNVSASYYEAFSGNSQVFAASVTLDIPKHPQANQIGAYLNYEPFSQYKLRLPVVGEVELPSRVGDMDQIQIIYNIDIPTGNANIRIITDRTDPPGNWDETTFTASIAIDIPLAQISKDIVGTTQSAVSMGGEMASAVGSAATLNLGQAAKSAANTVNAAIDVAVQANKPLPAFIGTAGNIGSYSAVYPSIYNNYSTVADPDIGLFGSPLCQVKTLNQCSGITVISTPHVEIPSCSKEDLEYIENIMAQGIRLE